MGCSLKKLISEMSWYENSFNQEFSSSWEMADQVRAESIQDLVFAVSSVSIGYKLEMKRAVFQGKAIGLELGK